MHKNYLVLYSGGIDSIMVAWKLAREEGNKNSNIVCLSVNEGNKGNREDVLNLLEKICDRDLNYININVEMLKETESGFYVPGRNLVLLSLAYQYAFRYNFDTVCLGSTRDFVYDDNDPDLLDNLNEAVCGMYEGHHGGFRTKLYMPFSVMDKLDVLKQMHMWAKSSKLFDELLYMSECCADPNAQGKFLGGSGCGSCQYCKRRTRYYIQFTMSS